MTTRTFVHYNDQDGNKCTREQYFNVQTSFAAIILSILRWLWGDFAFDLEICDPQSKKYIDFDEEYFHNHDLYGPSMTSEINLRIRRNSGGQHRSSTLNTDQPVVNVAALVINQQSRKRKIVHETNHQVSCSTAAGPEKLKLQAPNIVTMNETNPSIIFVKNVNSEQAERGQEGKPYIQGEKNDLEGDAIHGKVLPKVQVQLDGIAGRNGSKLELMVFLMWEMCEKGVRKLYHHPHRKLVANSTYENCVIMPVSDDMLSEGVSVTLPTEHIPSGKSVKNTEKILLCQLDNTYSAQTQYETGRLAGLLLQNGSPIWNTLVLSHGTIFTKSADEIGYIDVENDNNTIIETIYARKFKQKGKQDLNQLVMRLLPKTSKSKQASTQMVGIPSMNNGEALDSMILHPSSVALSHNGQLDSTNVEIRQNETAAYSNLATTDWADLQEPSNRHQHSTNIPASPPVTTQTYFYEPGDYHRQTSTTTNSAMDPTTMPEIICPQQTQRATEQLTDGNTQPHASLNLLEIMSSPAIADFWFSPTTPNRNYQSYANDELFRGGPQDEALLSIHNALQSSHEKYLVQKMPVNFHSMNDTDDFRNFLTSKSNLPIAGGLPPSNFDDLDLFDEL